MNEQLTPASFKVSRYDPRLGGVNCSYFVNGECLSHMASGLRWQDWINKNPGAVACPSSLPFWTKIILDNGREYFCLDRGGAIVKEGNLYWIDILTDWEGYNERIPYGAIRSGYIVLP